MAQLSANPNLEWLRKQAKRRLRDLRTEFPQAQLAHAQFDLAKDFGFTSWRDLKAHVDSLTIEGRMIVAAKNGDATMLAARARRPRDRRAPGARESSIDRAGAGVLHLMAKRGDAASVTWLLAHGANPSARWAHWDSEVTPLHLSCMANHPAVARAVLEGGADPRSRTRNTSPTHWAGPSSSGAGRLLACSRKFAPRPSRDCGRPAG